MGSHWEICSKQERLSKQRWQSYGLGTRVFNSTSKAVNKEKIFLIDTKRSDDLHSGSVKILSVL